jgi:hypothetical protein
VRGRGCTGDCGIYAVAGQMIGSDTVPEEWKDIVLDEECGMDEVVEFVRKQLCHEGLRLMGEAEADDKEIDSADKKVRLKWWAGVRSLGWLMMLTG